MRRAKLPLILILLLAISIVNAQDFQTSIALFNAGAGAYQSDSLESAKAKFQEAIAGFEALLESGLVKPSVAAYSKTYLATSHYYIGVIDESNENLDKASTTFQEAISDMRNEGIFDDNYVSSLYYKGMCSFRKYEIARSENAMANLLNSASGDFDVFLQDSVVLAEKEKYEEKISFANYLAGYSMFQYGILRTYKPNTRSNAEKAFGQAVKYFSAAQDALDEKIAISAILMEGESHYRMARLYGSVSSEAWEDSEFKDKKRSDMISEEIGLAKTAIDRMITTASAHPELQNYGKMSNYGNEVYAGSAGDNEVLMSALNGLLEANFAGDFENQKNIHFADAQLLNYLVFTGNQNAAINSLRGLVSTNPQAYYWLGWLNYIGGDYEKASNFFANYMTSVSTRTYQGGMANADAKFRHTESIFWRAVSTGNLALINEASNAYSELENPQGEFDRFLPSEIKDLVQIRLALIRIEGLLQQESLSKEDFNYAIKRAGDITPERLVEIARYFLEKGIVTTGARSQQALEFAGYALEKLLSTSSSAEYQNKGKFMKGVGLVKLATTYEDMGTKTKYLEQARSILGECSGAYRDEAKYVEGITYYIVNDYAQAKPIFTSLEGKGHMRAAYRKGKIMRDNCVSQGSIWAKIVASTDDSRPVHMLAKNDIKLLSCANSIPKQSAYGNVKPNPAMTYENLVDKEADIRKKKLEAQNMWQKICVDKLLPSIDELVSDTPPETNVEITFIVNPKGGNEELTIDGESELVNSKGNSEYVATIMRGEHTIQVKKKGFYFFETKVAVDRSTTINIDLKKAVRYSEGKGIASAKNPMALASSGEVLFVANNAEKQVMVIGASGGVDNTIPYSKLGIVTCTALEVSDGKLIAADSRHNVVKISDFDGGNVDYIALGKEPYDGKKLNNPSGIAASDGDYYVVDASNHRVLLFNGGTYRRSIGEEDLKKPIDVAIDSENKRIYVTDIIQKAIFVYDFGGVKIESKELESIEHPSYIYLDDNGYFYIADFITNTVAKYTNKFELLSTASSTLNTPRGITMIGLGPEATMYVATKEMVSVLKGGWDNQYMPE